MKKNLKLRSESFKIRLGNIEYNKEKIKNLVKNAEDDLVDILLLPELCLSGASLYDGYKNEDILEKCLESLKELKEFSKDFKVLFSLGLPFKDEDKIYNMVFLLKEGEILGTCLKDKLKDHEKYVFDTKDKNLDYDSDLVYVGDELVFLFNKSPIEVSGINILLSVGENEEKTIADSLYAKEKEKIDIVLNPCAKISYVDSYEDIKNKIKYLSNDTCYLMASSGLGESSTDFVYEGLSIIAKDGDIKKVKRHGKADFITRVDVKEDKLKFNFKSKIESLDKYPYIAENKDDFVKDVFDIVTRGLIQRMDAINSKKVVLGLSGGLDSTMALLFLVRAFKKMDLPLKNILLYTMPAFGTSDRTKSNAYKLSEAFGIKLNEIVIKDAVNIHLKDIGHDGKTQDIAYENAQARERTQILFDKANMENALVIGTGDKSEISQGFATYNGDHMSSYALNASLTKTELRFIVANIIKETDNKLLKEVLDDILKTPISPELKNENEKEISQKTEDIIGPYELIDFFIYEFSRNEKVEEIFYKASIAFKDDYNKETIKKWLKSFYKRLIQSQFKRSASVDYPNTRKSSFSPRRGFLLPSDMSYEIFMERIDKL